VIPFLLFSFQSPLNIIFKLDENIASNWDLYLITILTLFLGMIIYFRRPPYNPPAPPAQQQQQQDRPPQPEEPNNQDANIVQ
jgi:SEL1 protein